MRTNLIAGALLTLLIASLGLLLDAPSQSSVAWLFAAFHVSSLLGIAYAGFLLRGRLLSRSSRVVWGLLAAVGWRISWFPFMVFAGTFASYVEWAQVAIFGWTVWIYPSFLVAFAGLHAAVALGLYLPVSRWKWWPLVVAPFALQAMMISFTSLADLRPLPDDTLGRAVPVPEVRLPEANPYLPALEAGRYNLWQSLLPFAAGSTYSLIPDTPWGRVVQGVLEAEFNRNPVASSSDRVAEHYVGYLAAQRFIHTGTTRAEADQRPK